MADKIKRLGVGIKLDTASIKSELEKLRSLVQEAVKSFGLGSGSIDNLAKEVKAASDKMKQVKRDLVAYQKAQDADLAREEVAIAKRVNAELLALQKARYQQAAAVNKSLTASGGFNWMTGGMDANARSQMVSYYQQQAREADKLANATRRVGNAHKDLVAYQKAQDADLAREEVAIAKRVNAELLALQKARMAQASAVNKSLTASGGFSWMTGGMDANARSQMVSYYQQQAREADKLANATRRVGNAHFEGGRALDAYHNAILNLRGGISGYIKDVQNMILIQARWYGARMALFAAAQLPVDFVKQGVEYAVLLDTWNAKLLRWGASSGKVTEQARQDIAGLVTEMRKTVLDIPITFDKLGEAVEGFIGAGIDPSVVKEMAKQIAALAATYPEINMEQFGTSIVGFYNSFKDTIKGASTEAEKFKIIIDQMTAAQAKGVIRPEQFQLVTQHLGEAARNAGFTTEQMLAMSVVITDLGSRAGSAARAARGFMDQMSKSAVQEKLKLIGIEFEKNKTLAEQFDRIMTSLRDKLGGGGTMTMGAQTFLTSIMPVERAKAFTAMLKDWDKYKDTIQYILGSSGGVMAGLEPKLASISGQWLLLKNTMKELSSDSSLTVGGIKGVVSGLLEMARGALYAVQPTMATAENMRKLGDAGKIAYDATRLLKDVISGILTVLAPFKDMLVSLLKTMVEYQEIIKVGVSIWASYRIAIIAFRDVLIPAIILLYRMYTALQLVTSAEIASGLANLSKLLAGTQLAQLIGSLGKFGVAAGVGAVAAAGLGVAIYQINKEAKEAKEQLAQLADEARNLPDLQLKVRTAVTGAQITQLQKDIDSNPTALGYIDKVNKLKALKKEYDVLQNELSSRKGERAYEIPGMYPEKAGSGKGKPGPFDFPDLSNTGKNVYRLELRAAKEHAKAMLDIEKSNYDLRFAILSNFHKLGGSTIEEYYQAELENAEQNHRNRMAILDLEIKDIEAAYTKGMSEKGVTADKKAALADKRDADLEKVKANKVKTQNDYFKEVSNLETQFYLKSTNKLIQQWQHEADVLKLKAQGRIQQNQWTVEEEDKQNQWLYESGIMSMGEYYERRAQLINRGLQLAVENYQSDYEAWRQVWLRKVELAYGQQEKLTELYREQEKRNQELANNIAQANRDAASKTREEYRKLADDIRSTYFEPMKNGIRDFLDYSSDKFLDFREVALNVLNDVYNSMVQKFITNQIVGGLSSLTMSFFGSTHETGHSLSSLLGSAKGNVFSTPGLKPYLNTVVDRPTVFAFARGGIFAEEDPEAVMPLTRSKTGRLGVEATGMASPTVNVTVKVVNQSGQQLTPTKQETSQGTSPQEMIVTIWLDALERNAYGLRTAIGR